MVKRLHKKYGKRLRMKEEHTVREGVRTAFFLYGETNQAFMGK